MAKRVRITFVTNPTPTVNLVINIAYAPYSNAIGATVGGVSIAIGSTKEDTASNLFDYYEGLTFPSWLSSMLTISLASNIIYFDFEPDDDSNLLFSALISSQSSIVIEEVEIPSESDYDIALVRSTYSLRVIPNEFFDTTTLNLYNWNGDIADIPAVPSYSLSKPVVQLGDTVTSFDINELAKTGIRTTISNYVISGLQPIPYNASCWTYYDAKSYDGEDLVYSKQGTLLCLYGYGYFQELYNPIPNSNILITNNEHTHLRGYDNRIFFLTRDLTSLTVNGTPITVSFDLDFNYNNVVSINLNDYDTSTGTITLAFVYPEEDRTLIYTVKEECKYEVVNCVFTNKYGVPQSLFFTKVRKYTDEVEDSEYRGLLSEFGVYNSTDHLYKTFNSNSRTKITCNTDYLTDTENETFKQLMLSETVWLIENGVINPVTIDKKSIEYKNKLNDRLVQYSMDFKYAFDNINQIQ